MGILDEDVARVRESTDLVALVGEHLALRRVGKRYVGLCPFHAEKTPSFSVNPEMGLWHCFGCQKSGDAITFVREIEHLDFVGAVEGLAARSGITLRYDSEAVSKDRKKRERLHAVVAAAIDFYHRRLLEAPDAGGARRYLRSRGFDGAAVRRFRLGFAPEGFDALSRSLQVDTKIARQDVVEAGLAFVNRANKLQDQFRERLMFPIHDQRGDPVGFGGRALGERGPKYKNSPETSIYHKSRLLYWLHEAKGEIVARRDVIVCEGYTDVMACVLADLPHAVATCGTALTDEHVEVLKNLSSRVTLAYDADAAGQGAAERWYQWEQRHEIEVRVASLPAGRDPADVWHDDPDALRAAVEGARPFLAFRLDRVLDEADLAGPEGRARAAERAATIVAEHPSDLVRDQYVMQLADRLAIQAERLREAVERARSVGPRRGDRPARRVGPAPSEAPPARPAPGRGVDRRELDLLRWTIHEPDAVAAWIEGSLFADPLARAVFDRLASAETFHEALHGSEGEVRALLERLAVEEPDVGGDAETVHAHLIVNAAEPAGSRLLARMLRDGDERASEVKRLLDELAHAREVGDWSSGEQVAKQLVGWIAAGSADDSADGSAGRTGEVGGP